MFVGVQEMPSIKKGRIFIIDLSPRGKNQQFSRGEYSGEEFLRGSFTWHRTVGAREGTCNLLFGRSVNPMPTPLLSAPPRIFRPSYDPGVICFRYASGEVILSPFLNL